MLSKLAKCMWRDFIKLGECHLTPPVSTSSCVWYVIDRVAAVLHDSNIVKNYIWIMQNWWGLTKMLDPSFSVFNTRQLDRQSYGSNDRLHASWQLGGSAGKSFCCLQISDGTGFIVTSPYFPCSHQHHVGILIWITCVLHFHSLIISWKKK